MSEKIYFISGIDTDAGKSYAAGALAASMMREGVNVITQKFIQTGCGSNMDEVSEDIALHRKLMGVGLLPEDIDHTTCPLRFSYPASPDFAARLEGKEPDLDKVEESTRKLLEKYDTVLIEGAGGLLVPVKGKYTVLDYVVEKSLPLILVTNPKLGSVNHALLSLEVCRNRGVRVAKVLYNHYPVTSDRITDDTRKVLLEYLDEYFPYCEFIEIPRINLK